MGRSQIFLKWGVRATDIRYVCGKDLRFILQDLYDSVINMYCLADTYSEDFTEGHPFTGIILYDTQIHIESTYNDSVAYS